jgi:hypothetical protein
MKKVRYALGVMGAAPALGLFTPVAALPAATHPQPTAKRVSHAPAKGPQYATCHGSRHAYFSNNVVGWTIWYGVSAHHTCVGTVEAHGYVSSSPNAAYGGYRVRVYGHESTNAKVDWARSWPHPLPLPVGTEHHDFAVQREFPNDVKVCLSAKSFYSGTRNWQRMCPVLPGLS